MVKLIMYLFNFSPIVIALWLFFTPSTLAQDETSKTVFVSDFANRQLQDWQQKSFVGNTQYTVVTNASRIAIKANTHANASALYQKISIDLNQTPFLNWSWRVNNVYSIDNQQIKNGDDFAARIYVIVKYGWLPWQTRALNYVWSNNSNLSQKTYKYFWLNPFTANAAMIPVQNGEQGLGEWHSYKVDIQKDFYNIFGQRIITIDGVAIMADSDNAGGSAVSYFGDISFTQN